MERTKKEKAEREEAKKKKVPSGQKSLTRKAEQTRKKLLSAALALFKKNGYDNVTVEDITKKAGVAKGSFYVYFSAKEAVLSEYFRQVEDLYEETYRKMSKSMTTRTKLLRLVDTMCEFCQEEFGIDFLRVIYANQLLHPYPDVSILNHPERRIVPILREIAVEGKKKKEVPYFIDESVFAREVAHLAHGVIYDWCIDNGSYDLREEGHRVFSQVLEMADAYEKR